MTVNIANLDLEIAKRINSSTEEEVLILSKCLEKLKTVNIIFIDRFENLPSAALSTGTIAYVQSEDRAYYPDIDNDIWISVTSDVNSFLSMVGENGGTVSIKYGGNGISLGFLNDSTASYLQDGLYKKVKFAFDSTPNDTTFLFLKYDGTIWTFGSNIHGTTAQNIDIFYTAVLSSNYGSFTPVQEITFSTNWTDLSANERTVIALKSDGTLWGWGVNNFGQLGTNNLTYYSSPVQETSSSTDWVKMSSGFNHTAAIKSDGSLWSWGRNNLGQIGTNNVTCYSSPVQETSSSTDWAEVSCGSSHTVAIKTDGTLWGWGINNNGQLGTNNTTSYSSPVQEVSSSTDWSSLPQEIVHGASTFAIKTDGTLWGWGYNLYGQLGTNDVTCYSSPVQEVSSSTNWSSVSCYLLNTGAIKTDGTMWLWGYNAGGVLRQGDTTNRSSPVQESESLSTWLSVSLAEDEVFAIRGDSNYRV